MSTPSERLVARLRAENGMELPQGTYAGRTYASRAWLSSGAWTWRLYDAGHQPIQPHVGSQWRITDLLRFPRLAVTADRFGDRCVDPDATVAEIREILGCGR